MPDYELEDLEKELGLDAFSAELRADQVEVAPSTAGVTGGGVEGGTPAGDAGAAAAAGQSAGDTAGELNFDSDFAEMEEYLQGLK